MAIRLFLAMTAAEIMSGAPFPERIAWMACHFSPYTTGLSNIPDSLPTGSLLILNDRTPIGGHDPGAVEWQLRDCLELCKCDSILLDFQRPGVDETAVLAAHLAGTLPCPLAVSEHYAAGLDCPVFLSAPPHHIPLREYLSPWMNREIWLETALDTETITLTEDGAKIAVSMTSSPTPHREEILHCHYRTDVFTDRAVFTLRRTREDLEAMLAEAETLGVTTAVGLFQELFSRDEA